MTPPSGFIAAAAAAAAAMEAATGVPGRLSGRLRCPMVSAGIDPGASGIVGTAVDGGGINGALRKIGICGGGSSITRI